MSDSDVSIPQKVAALADALGRVKQQIIRRGRLFRSFQRWYEAKGEDAILRFLDPMDGSQKDGSLWDGSEDVLDAAAEFVEAVATADQMLNSTPVSALEPLSKLTGGVPWDVRTRRALRAIQYETAILECHSMDPEGLLLGLWWMGADRLKQMDSKLMELELELKERIIDLQSLPGEPTKPTIAITDNRKGDVQTVTTAKPQASNSVEHVETNKQELEEMERNTPVLDTGSIEWIASRKENQKKLGYPTTTLATYRLESSGGRQLSPYFGVDKDGRRWRRETDKTEGSTVYYFADDIKKYQRKVSN